MINKSSQICKDLNNIISAAIFSVVPGENLIQYLPTPPKGRCVVVGAGKASAAMAAVIDKFWTDVDLSGVVSTRYGHGVNAGRIRVIEASHPVPDESSELAAKEMLQAVKDLTKDDLVLALISGGGSATCTLPIDGLSLSQTQQITKELLHSGATISEMNCVRKAICKIKGGGLAAAAFPAAVHSLVISDIPGDKACDVASGPTIFSDNCVQNPLDVLTLYNVGEEIGLSDLIAKTNCKLMNSSQRVTHDLVATPMIALKSAAKEAKKLGYTPLILSDQLEGESKQVSQFLANIVTTIIKYSVPIAPPIAIITGGETTVTIGNQTPGRGGRNTEFLLSFAIETAHLNGVFASAIDSDGIDGTEDAAGAIITPTTLTRANQLGLRPSLFLENHDSYSFFEKLNDLVITGPTLTNVNDIRVVLIK